MSGFKWTDRHGAEHLLGAPEAIDLEVDAIAAEIDAAFEKARSAPPAEKAELRNELRSYFNRLVELHADSERWNTYAFQQAKSEAEKLAADIEKLIKEALPIMAVAELHNERLEEFASETAGSKLFAEPATDVQVFAISISEREPTVLRTKDGYMIMDGRLRWHAIGAVHGEESDIGVRCVVFAGTEEEAVQWVADSALGGMPRSQIEMARAILNLQRVASISQKSIAERYPVLKKDQVSRMTIAARTVERFPTVFNLLAEPDRVSIDTCVKFAQFMKTATEQMREEVLEAAELRVSEGVAFKASELFDALGIEVEGGAKAKTPGSPEPSDVLESIPILGFDDQPVGTVEKLDERVMRLQLPDPTSMTADEREVAARAFVAEIFSYFGLMVAE